MANIIRYISSEDSGNLPASFATSWPSNKTNNKKERIDNSESQERKRTEWLPSETDPHRARFLEIAHPGLRQLRASKENPNYRKAVERSLLEQMLHWAESMLEG